MFKEKVKNLLSERDMKLGTLASSLGISYSTMDSIINGDVDEMRIGVDKVLAIAEYFNLSVEELYGRPQVNDNGPELSSEEKEFLKLWREATPEAQISVKMVLESNKRQVKKEAI